MSIFDKEMCVSGWTASRNFFSGLKNEPPHIGKRKREMRRPSSYCPYWIFGDLE